MQEEIGIDINKILTEIANKWLTTIIEKSADFFVDQSKKLSIDVDYAFKDYIKKSYDKYSRIKTILYKTEPKYIYSFYEYNELMYKNETYEAVSINTVLNISQFSIITGTGGMGKSTLMKHFLLSGLKGNEQIPLFVELKNFKDDKVSLYDFIFESLETLGFRLDKEYFEYALKSGCFIFLLDGYDEIPNNNDSNFLIQLEKFCDQYTNNSFIISSRPNDEFIKLSRFHIFTMELFSKEKATYLINRIEYDEDIKERFVVAIEEGLYEKHESFASNPLLLTILLLTYQEYAEIPNKLHLFYYQAFETLLVKHDANKNGFKRELKSNVSNDLFTKIFSIFCFKTFVQKKNEFSEKDLKNEIGNAIKRLGRKDISTDDYIYDLLNAVCVIFKDGLDFKFIHRSFQEYFAAAYINDLSDDNQKKVINHLIKEGFMRIYGRDTITMLFDMNKERFEDNILIPMLKKIEENWEEGKDKFEYYLVHLVDECNFSIEEDGKLFVWPLSSENPINSFLFDIVYFYKPDYKLPEGVDCRIKRKIISSINDKETFEPFYDNENPVEFELNIETEEIIKDQEILKYIKTTWVGSCVTVACSLLETLTQKKELFENDIEDILDL